MGECPEIPFLCCEACCCTFLAVQVNRYFVRQMYSLENDPCDECLIWCAILISWLVCLLQIFCSEYDWDWLECIADIFVLSVIGCSLTQNKKRWIFVQVNKESRLQYINVIGFFYFNAQKTFKKSVQRWNW